jgi:hypothetical protein
MKTIGESFTAAESEEFISALKTLSTTNDDGDNESQCVSWNDVIRLIGF